MTSAKPLQAAGELSLVALSVAVVAGFSRLFDDGAFFWRVALVTVAAHAFAVVVRRRGHGIAVSAVVSLVGITVLSAIVYYASTTRFGLPTPTTRQAAVDDLRAAWAIFGEDRAPVVPHVGFLVAAGAAMSLSAFLADWAAFRLVSPVEAVAPVTTIFVFSSLMGADQHRGISAALFIGALLSFFLTHRLARHDQGASWLGGSAAVGNGAIVRAGVGVGVAAMAFGLLLGPTLPGAEAEPIVDWREFDGGSGTRFAISPLVDIRSRLVELPDEEMMIVTSPVRDYWRLTSLDQFDGVKWTSSGRFNDAVGVLESQVPPTVEQRDVRQDFEILGLRQIWLPAAFEPSFVVENGGAAIQYEARSGTLIIGEDRETSDGLSYTIDSRLPIQDPATIAALEGTPIPADIVDGYTDLPDDYSELARTTAAEIVADLTSPYLQSLALQEHFQQYTYDLDVDSGHANDDIDGFLDNRAGYCEQFAGTFASMARSLGIPARVAVGFTWGEPTGNPDEYLVRGKQAHAWPEVFLAGVGWVRFEPTPGRGAPGDTAVTGLPAGQDEPEAVTGTTTTTTAPAGATTTGPPRPIPGDELGIPEAAAGGGGSGDDSSGPGTIAKLAVGGGVLLALAAVCAAVTAGAKISSQRRRLGRLGTGPRGEIARAWTRAVDLLDRVGIAARPAETPLEFARRVRNDLGDAGHSFGLLAQATTDAAFSDHEPTDRQIDVAGTALHDIVAFERSRLTPAQRLRWWIDPRTLAPPWLRLSGLRRSAVAVLQGPRSAHR